MKNKLIGEIMKSSGKKIIWEINEFKGKIGLDIREYFKLGTDKWAPTKKGIRIDAKDISAVVKFAEQAEDAINKGA